MTGNRNEDVYTISPRHPTSNHSWPVGPPARALAYPPGHRQARSLLHPPASSPTFASADHSPLAGPLSRLYQHPCPAIRPPARTPARPPAYPPRPLALPHTRTPVCPPARQPLALFSLAHSSTGWPNKTACKFYLGMKAIQSIQ